MSILYLKFQPPCARPRRSRPPRSSPCTPPASGATARWCPGRSCHRCPARRSRGPWPETELWVNIRLLGPMDFMYPAQWRHFLEQRSRIVLLTMLLWWWMLWTSLVLSMAPRQSFFWHFLNFLDSLFVYLLLILFFCQNNRIKFQNSSFLKSSSSVPNFLIMGFPFFVRA